MRFTAGSGDLAAAVARVAQGLPARPWEPVYGGILVTAGGGVRLTASDGDVTFTADLETAEIPSRADYGSFVLPGLIAEVSRYLAKGSVDIFSDGKTATVGTGKSSFTFPAQDGKDFPSWKIPDWTESPAGEIDAEEFASAVRKVSAAASKTEVHLSCVNLVPEPGKLNLVSTDRYRMGIVVLDYPDQNDYGDVEILVPVKAIERFARSAEGSVRLSWDDSTVRMAADGFQVTARRLAGKFLPWRKVLGKMPGEWIETPREDLIRAVRMAALVAGPENRITLGFGDQVTVEAQGERGTCHEEIPVKTGLDISFPLGAQALLDGLNAAGGETVDLAVTPGALPVLWLRGGDLKFMIQSRRDN